MLNRARHVHDVSLLVDDFFPLYSLELHAYLNSNLNRTTCIRILWTEDEMKVLESQDGQGNRMAHVLRSHSNLSDCQPSSSNDSEDIEFDQNGSGDDDSSNGSFGNENGASHNSDDMDDPNDEDVGMENQQQDEESLFRS